MLGNRFFNSIRARNLNVSRGGYDPCGDLFKKRLKKLSSTDLMRDESKTQSGFGKKISNWVGRDEVYPTNVLHMATECAYKAHSAAFPVDLPFWFIKLFTEKEDIVLDPFGGSGTTALAERIYRGTSVAIDIQPNLLQRNARERLGIINRTLDVFE